jgi:excisionase family DNA binding protein
MSRSSTLMTVREVAEAFGCHRDTVYVWIREGRLSFVQPTGPRGWIRIERDAYEAFLERGRTLAAAERAARAPHRVTADSLPGATRYVE